MNKVVYQIVRESDKDLVLVLVIVLFVANKALLSKSLPLFQQGISRQDILSGYMSYGIGIKKKNFYHPLN